MTTKAKPSEVPGCLAEVGRAKWDEMAGRLSSTTPLVLDQLLVYCTAFERWTTLQESLKDSKGIMVHRNQANEIMRAYADPRLVAAAQVEKQMREAGEWLKRMMRE